MSLLATEPVLAGIASMPNRTSGAYQSGLLGGIGMVGSTLAADPVGLSRVTRVTIEDLLAEIVHTTRALAQVQVESSGSIYGWSPQASLPIGDSSGSLTRRRERELSWLKKHGGELEEFVGQWIAVEGEQVVAHSVDPLDVVREARAKGVKRPFLHRVQRARSADEGYIGL